MGTSGWTAVFVPIGIGLMAALFRRLFPVRRDRDAEHPFTDEERRVYARWLAWSPLPIFTFIVLFGYAWYLAFKWAADMLYHPVPATRYLIRPSGLYWALPALFLGVISSAIPTDRLYRCLLGDRYRRFDRFCNERAGYDGNRALAWLSAFIVAGSAVFFLAGVTCFARFDEAGVEIARPFASRSVFYGYARVTSIEHWATFRAPNGTPIPHYIITFDDGSTWSTRIPALRDPVPDLDGQIMELVARRSGRSIVEKP